MPSCHKHRHAYLCLWLGSWLVSERKPTSKYDQRNPNLEETLEKKMEEWCKRRVMQVWREQRGAGAWSFADVWKVQDNIPSRRETERRRHAEAAGSNSRLRGCFSCDGSLQALDYHRGWSGICTQPHTHRHAHTHTCMKKIYQSAFSSSSSSGISTVCGENRVLFLHSSCQSCWFVIVLFFLFLPWLYHQTAGPAGDCSGNSVALLKKHLKRDSRTAISGRTHINTHTHAQVSVYAVSY